MSKHYPQSAQSGLSANPDETWVRGRKTTQPVVVRKAAVRVAAGVTTGNRPGTFAGPTNYRGTERPENRLSRLR